ncbi:MAG: acyltransferase, partial [Actinomycetales bacterium]
YHALPERLPGGFVGVDVFFVLSGFLITALLLRERERAGTVRLRSFWVRRVRRLVPALVVMLTLVSAATLMVGRETGSGLRSQVVGALTWTSNWIQIHQGWSYSDQHLPPLLNHLWSLGIEEQFYVLWPLLLLAALVVLKRRVSLYAVAALALVSIALMAFWYRGGDPNRAYMGLDSHAFGLLLGAALALSTASHLLGSTAGEPTPANATRRRTVLGALGLAGILAFAVLVAWNSDANFLGGLGLASLASVAVIHAAANPGPVASVLGWAPLRWLGERSYGLYLWHWPLIVFAVRLAPPTDAEVAGCLAVAVAVVVSAISYRWVEVPMCRDGIGAT